MNVFHATEVGDDWAQVHTELDRAFQMSRSAAQAEQSFVFVVHHDDLLGRRGAGNAMVATGLLSAARTAALEGSRRGWTVNVIAHDDSVEPDVIDQWVQWLEGDSRGLTGEVIRLGAGHLGKTLP
ncbi:MAG TPA: hypothetical protein VI141_03050 [Acidimicrobiia bacterium]